MRAIGHATAMLTLPYRHVNDTLPTAMLTLPCRHVNATLRPSSLSHSVICTRTCEQQVLLVSYVIIEDKNALTVYANSEQKELQDLLESFTRIA